MSLNLFPHDHRIEIGIPLTTPTGKVRIKKRKNIFEYGEPFAGRQNPFEAENYAEWQISYSAPQGTPTAAMSTLSNIQFCDSKGTTQVLYELSECLFYFAKWGILQKRQLQELKDFVSNISAADLLANHPDCQIKRSSPVEKTINALAFDTLTTEYPQLIHRFAGTEIIAEITIREKQRAVGVQPMLYCCFPLASLSNGAALIGRCATTKEFAQFVFDENNCVIVLEMMQIFGMLSASHQHDVVAIITAIL